MSSSTKSMPASRKRAYQRLFLPASGGKPRPPVAAQRRALVQRGRVDQVPDRFSLGQVDPPVKICAQRELAGIGEPRAGQAQARSTQNRSTTGEP